MKELIRIIFDQHGFQHLELEDYILYFPEDDSPKREYWVVAEGESTDILRKQAQIAERCRTVMSTPDLEKNSSLLILSRCHDQEDLELNRGVSITVEEDPYHFKKYCLNYTDTESNELKLQAGENQISAFLAKIILDPDCFATYKIDPRKLGWQQLVYRLANKLPFLKITVKTNKGLKPLFDSNRQKIAQKKLDVLNDIITDLDFLYSEDEVAAFSATQLMTILQLPTEKDDED